MTDIPAQRLQNQRIAHSDFKTPEAVVSWLGAIQAQDYASAEWSVGARLPGAAQAIVEQAIADQKIIRTWMLRGTLHMVAAADVHWMLALVAPKMLAGNARRYKELELDEPTLMLSNKLLEAHLENGESAERHDLFAMLEEKGIVTKGQRGIHLLQRAAFDGLLSRGITRGGSDVYVALKPPGAQKMTREESLAELAQRYFVSHGPATLQDFAWWTGLSMGDARTGFAAIQSRLNEIKIDGAAYWTAADGAAPDESTYLLPGFDEYVLGYKDRGIVLDPQYANLICPGGNGVFYPTIVHHGQIVGTWKRAVKKGRVTITPTPFVAGAMGDFDVAAQKFAAFVAMDRD